MIKEHKDAGRVESSSFHKEERRYGETFITSSILTSITSLPGNWDGSRYNETKAGEA
ncbi:hypothetical protein ACEQPO_11680 [Bacillus sp. SL00103]